MITSLTAEGVTVLKPSAGMVLTNGEAYSTRVYLGARDSAANWREISVAEVPDPDAEPVDEVEQAIRDLEGSA